MFVDQSQSKYSTLKVISWCNIRNSVTDFQPKLGSGRWGNKCITWVLKSKFSH